MQLFAASTDDAETQEKFAKELGVSYPILADPEKKVARAMGVLSVTGLYANRRTFYVGKDGKLLAIDEEVDLREHGVQVLAKLEELGLTKKEKADDAPTSRPD